MLNLRDVRLRRGPQVLFEHANLAINAGEKLGIVGRNGCGKSSLLALVRGELSADAGEYTYPEGLALASLTQELPRSEATLCDYLLEGDVDLGAVAQAIAQAERVGDGLRLSTLHAEYERLGGYSARSRAAELAAGLGFAPEDFERPLAQLSGGLQMRANLGHALMRRSDVLLLDEPTNHLDLDALVWLEHWLQGYRGTLLIVSHDRELLDGVVQRIVHIEGGALTAYSGNYSDFELQHAERRRQTAALAESQRREIERIHAFVERFRAKASKARQAQSRLKQLARLEVIAPEQAESGFDWHFEPPAKVPRPLVSLDRVAAAYDAKPVLSAVSLTIEPGDRIGVLGRNGAGKSTLMRILAGTLAPTRGEATVSADAVPGFFAQLELDRLAPGGTPLEELVRLGGTPVEDWPAQRLRDHLGRFGFRDDRVFEPVGNFSGGERARLALAVLVAHRPNLLLLDEPTNHLDIPMRQALTLALQEFPGAVIVVAHDRALLGAVCDRFLLVANGTVTPFEGDLEDYARWLAAAAPQASDVAAPAPLSRREQRRLEAEVRNRSSGLRAQVRDVEQRLDELTLRRRQIEAQLADPALYAPEVPQERQRELSVQHRAACAEIDELEERWLALSETLPP